MKDVDVKTELIKKLRSVMDDSAMQEIMSKNLLAMAIKDADERIANKVIALAAQAEELKN